MNLSLSFFLFCLAVFLSGTGLRAQDFLLAGYLLDDSNGEAIANGQIRLQDGPGLLSDFNGYFQLLHSSKEPDKKLQLIVSALGYETDTITLPANTRQNAYIIRLKPLFLATVEVKATAANLNKHLSPSVERLKQVPVLLGQPDLVKSLTLFPGVSGGQEGLSELYIRGGDADQNLVLLDGSTIYNLGHLFGFLSVFNPDVVRSFDLHKDFIPARFGGRLASVLNVTTLDGNQRKKETVKSFGLLTAAYTTQGPLRDSSWTYHLGGRMSHSAWLSLLSLPPYTRERSPLILFGTFDFNAKLVKRFENGRKIRLFSYVGEDAFGGLLKDDDINQKSSAIIQYGNVASGLNYSIPNKRGDLHSIGVNFNTFRNTFRAREVWTISDDKIVNRFFNKGQIKELSFHHHFDGRLGKHEYQWGLHHNNRWIEPVRISSTDNERSGIMLARFINRTLSTAAYGTLNYQLDQRWRTDIGLRWNLYQTLGTAYSSWHFAPRVAINWIPTAQTALFLSYNRTTQDLHAALTFVAGVPTTTWLPSTSNSPVESSDIYSAGYKKLLRNGQIQAGLYYKTMQNQVILPNFSFTQANNNNWEEELNTQGDGYAYGLELYYENALTEDLFVSSSYAYSRSWRKYSSINDNTYFPYDFDRPHDFNLQIQLDLSAKWQLSTAFYYQSGRPITLPTALSLGLPGLANSFIYTIYNNGRLKDYHRLDLVLRKKVITRKDRAGNITMGFYNVYGRSNPLAFSISGKTTAVFNEQGQIVNQHTPTRSTLTLFRFLPILSYEVRY